MNSDSSVRQPNSGLVDLFKRLFVALPRWTAQALAAVAMSRGYSFDDVYATLVELTRDGWFGRDGEWYVASEQFSRIQQREDEKKELGKLRLERDKAVMERDNAFNEKRELSDKLAKEQERAAELENLLNAYRSAARQSLEPFVVDYDTAREIVDEFEKAALGD